MVHVHYREGSQLVVGKARRADAGVYKCVATSVLGSAHADTTVTVNKGTFVVKLSYTIHSNSTQFLFFYLLNNLA